MPQLSAIGKNGPNTPGQKSQPNSSALTPATRQTSAAPSGPFVMPANVRAGQVIGLVEVTGGLGSVIDMSKLADEFAANIETLLPILDTGEMLGLVKVEKGDVTLTEFGHKFQKTAKRKMTLLREPLSKIEPFKTSLNLLSTRKSISARDVAEALLSRHVRWHHSAELNEAAIQALLIHWAIYARLLRYDGRDGKFQKP